MKALLECLRDWLNAQHDDVNARHLAIALAEETIKRADSVDATQRDFDAQELAAACNWSEANNFDAAKRKVERANLVTYLSSRRTSIEEFFRSRCHTQAMRIVKRSTSGKRRAQWSLEAYDLQSEDAASATSSGAPTPDMSPPDPSVLIYDYIAAGKVKPSWLGCLVLGGGKFPTRSARGVLWVSSFLVPVLVVVACLFVIWSMLYLARPVQARDLATVVIVGGVVWAFWYLTIRPMLWLLDDRLVPAPELFVGWKEEPAQLEMAQEDGKRMLGLVRYSGTCPVCAAKVELRYGDGQSRRLFGRCIESPQEHVFTFDRVTRRGSRAYQC